MHLYAHLYHGTSVYIEGSPRESISLFYHVDSGDEMQVINLNGRWLYPLRHICPPAQWLAFKFYFSP